MVDVDQFIKNLQQVGGVTSTLFRDYKEAREVVELLLRLEPEEQSGEIWDKYFPSVEHGGDIDELERQVAILSKEIPKGTFARRFKIYTDARVGPAQTADSDKVGPYQQLLVQYGKQGIFKRIPEIENIITQMLFFGAKDPNVWITSALICQGLKRSTEYAEFLGEQHASKIKALQRVRDSGASQRLYKNIIEGWDKALNLVVISPESYPLNLPWESSRPVFEVKGLSDILIKCLSNMDIFDGEPFLIVESPQEITEGLDDLVVGLKYLSLIKEAIRDHPQYSVPVVVHFGYHRHIGFYYMMIKSPGETLQDLILRDASTLEQDLMDVAEYMGFQSAKIPTTISKRGEIDIVSKIESCLTNEDLTTNREIARIVLSNLGPVVNALEYAVLVANRDFHPEQFLRHKGKTTSLDWDGKGLVRGTETPNTLEYGGKILKEIKESFVHTYYDSFKRNSGKDGIADMSLAMLVHWNGTIVRGIALSSAWSSDLRPSMHARRGDVIDNVIHAIDMIKQDYPWYCSQGDFDQNYNRIAYALNLLKDGLRTPKDPLEELAKTFEELSRLVGEAEKLRRDN